MTPAHTPHEITSEVSLPPGVRLVACTHALHAQAILDILNDAIINTTALYDYQPRPFTAMEPWFATKVSNGFPVVGLEDDEGRLLGFASYGTFRNFPAFKYSVEHSVYVAPAARGRGLGELLLRLIVEQARARQVHVVIGAIDASNAASIALHRKVGFEASGLIRQAGFKFGRWLDLAFYQRTLDTPADPVDG